MQSLRHALCLQPMLALYVNKVGWRLWRTYSGASHAAEQLYLQAAVAAPTSAGKQRLHHAWHSPRHPIGSLYCRTLHQGGRRDIAGLAEVPRAHKGWHHDAPLMMAGGDVQTPRIVAQCGCRSATSMPASCTGLAFEYHQHGMLRRIGVRKCSLFSSLAEQPLFQCPMVVRKHRSLTWCRAARMCSWSACCSTPDSIFTATLEPCRDARRTCITVHRGTISGAAPAQAATPRRAASHATFRAKGSSAQRPGDMQRLILYLPSSSWGMRLGWLVGNRRHTRPGPQLQPWCSLKAGRCVACLPAQLQCLALCSRDRHCIC